MCMFKFDRLSTFFNILSFWSIVYWECFSPSKGNTVGLFTYCWKEPTEIQVYGNGKKNCCKHLMFRMEKAQLNGYYIEVLKFKNHLDILFIELKKVN